MRELKLFNPYLEKIFNEGTDFKRDGSQFDCLFKDGDTYKIGSLEVTAIHTPGHTPACMTHLIGDAAFVGDTLFMPDGGTARADFLEEMRARFIDLFIAFSHYLMRRDYLCVTIMAPMVAILFGKQRFKSNAG